MTGHKDVAVGDARTAGSTSRRRRTTPALIGAITMCAALFGGASSAWAGVGFSMVPTVPQNVAIGDTGVPSSLVISNASVNGPGETGYTNDSMRIDSITVVPSCGSTAVGANCSAPFLDPGVLVPNPLSGTGEVGTACANRTFTFALIDAAQGKYSVTIDGAPLVLGPSSGTLAVRQCIINYTVDVLKLPTIDSEVGTPGLQTGQKAAVGGTDIGGGGNAANIDKTGSGVGTAGTTVARATPRITTVASANIVLGAGNLSDQATVSGLVAPITNANAGTVVFRLYEPGDTICASPIYTSPSQPLTLNGAQTSGTAQSPSYTPTVAGVYRWIAEYSGDANNLSATGLCNEASEMTTVSAPASTPPAAPPPPPPAVTPPPPPPPAAGQAPSATVCTTPPGPAPAGGELCARGTAAIRGRTGCQGTRFNVVVSGRQISRVVFALNGRVIRTLTRPNSGTRYVLNVNPRTLRPGVHRIIARTTFRSRSGTRPRLLRVTFSRCARRAATPAFTG